MNWTILTDNRSDDSRLLTEHGLSVYVETSQHNEIFREVFDVPISSYNNTNLVDLLARLVFFLYLCTRFECMKEKR